MAVIYISTTEGVQGKYRLPTDSDTVVSIGRDESCMVSLPDILGLSGKHCEITYSPEGYWIKDNNSTNGVVLDGERVESVILQEKTAYKLGAAFLMFDAETPEEAPSKKKNEGSPKAGGNGAALGKNNKKPDSKITPKKNLINKGSVGAEDLPSLKDLSAPGNKSGLRMLYVVLIFVFSFIAGLSLRHWQVTGGFYLWGGPAAGAVVEARTAKTTKKSSSAPKGIPAEITTETPAQQEQEEAPENNDLPQEVEDEDDFEDFEEAADEDSHEE